MRAVAIRPASERDWSHVAQLLDASSLPTAGAQEHLSSFCVAEREGAIVGCAGVERYDGAGLLRSVAVSETERGRGTGARLVERCIADAAASGMSELILLTTTAEPYFRKFGFDVIPRDAVPASVRASVEFREACCASATVMRLSVGT